MRSAEDCPLSGPHSTSPHSGGTREWTRQMMSHPMVGPHQTTERPRCPPNRLFYQNKSVSARHEVSAKSAGPGKVQAGSAKFSSRGSRGRPVKGGRPNAPGVQCRNQRLDARHRSSNACAAVLLTCYMLWSSGGSPASEVAPLLLLLCPTYKMHNPRKSCTDLLSHPTPFVGSATRATADCTT